MMFFFEPSDLFIPNQIVNYFDRTVKLLEKPSSYVYYIEN